MLGLFGTLELGVRALQTQRQGVEVTGHNLANVNNPAYARQRLAVQTSLPLPTRIGPEGTGVEAVAIRQLRSAYLDQAMGAEISVTGSLSAQQRVLQDAQARLGEALHRSVESTGTTGVSTETGILSQLNHFFNSWQALSAAPASLAERQAVIASAEELTRRLRAADTALNTVTAAANASLTVDVAKANTLVESIATLSERIAATEAGSSFQANDLRDLRQQRLEELAALAKFQANEDAAGGFSLSVGGTLLVQNGRLVERLEAYDAGGGPIQVRAAGTGTTLTLTGGGLEGTMTARDTTVASLRDDLNQLASALMAEVNALHSGGFSLSGVTGAPFFLGTGLADIALNPALRADPRALQAAGVPGAAGDNQVALQVARLATQSVGALGGRTFYDLPAATAARLGESLQFVNASVEQQGLVQAMLSRQRDALGGVSLDEEIANMLKYQKAFEASARLVTTVSEMLDVVIQLKR